MFYLVDKPVGPSSNQALNQVRRFFGAEKAGHAGTLDPLASGLLLAATEGSTKLLSLLDSSTKSYCFTFDITRTSESLDLGTPPTSLPPEHPIFTNPPSREQVENVLQKFWGDIEQIPPKYSAVWIDGKRAYHEARKGNAIKLPSRKIFVHSLELVSYEFPYITLNTHVSSGAYVRSLARDIGEALRGAGVVTGLRRTGIWHLTLDASLLTYHELHPGERIWIREVSYEELFPTFGKVNLSEEEYVSLSFGLPIETAEEFKYTSVFGYYEGKPVALLRQEENRLQPVRFKI